MAGAAGGLVGGIYTPAFGTALGSGVGVMTAAIVSGGDPGQGFLYGMGAAMGTTGIDYLVSPTGETFSPETKAPRGEVLVFRPKEIQGYALGLGLGEPEEHVVISEGNGKYIDASPGTGRGVQEFTSSNSYFSELEGREFVRLGVSLNVDNAQVYIGQTYGFGTNQQICTTLATALSNGVLTGITPEQMYLNATGATRSEILYYDLANHGAK